MKHTRSIRLFIIMALIVAVCFWLGFSLGKKSQMQAELARYGDDSSVQDGNVISTDGNTETESDVNGIENDNNSIESSNNFQAKAGDETVTWESNDGTDTAVSGESFQTPNFYLKNSGEYLTVYVAATGEAYFETDLKVSDLPAELQAETDQGIPFYDLEDLYHFLENYSS